MVAGFNVAGRIWAISESVDDASGGAVITGTVVHANVPARIQQQPEEQLLLQQGLEINKSFTALIAPVTLDVDERYEFEVTNPPNYYLYGKRLRIINVRQADFVPGDQRNYIMLTMTRSHKANALQ